VLLALLCLGFDWPGRAERLVHTLARATTPRDKRDALRLLSALEQVEGWPAALELRGIEAASQDPDADVRLDAWLLLLAVRGDAATLEAGLHDPSPRVRQRALTWLAHTATDAATRRAALLRAALDPDPAVRAAALEGLGELTDTGVLPVLMRCLGDASLDVQVAAARALGSRPERVSADALLASFQAALPELRVAILDALSSRADPRGRDLCARARDDDDEAVARSARRCEARLEDQGRASSAPPRATVDRDARPYAQPEAGAQPADQASSRAPSEAAIGHAQGEPAWLLPLEQSAEPSLSPRQAAHVLRALERSLGAGDVLAADPLLLWLPRAPAELRGRIAQLIERTGAPLEIDPPTITAWLAVPSPALRASYVRLLGQSRSLAARLALRRALDDPAQEVREASVVALSRTLQAEDVSALLERLAADDDEARQAALRVLADAPPAAVANRATRSALVAALEREIERPGDRNAALALRVLGGLHEGRAQRAVRRALDDPRAGRRIAALRASVLDHSEAARSARLRALAQADVPVAATAAVALTLAGDPAPLATLRAWLDDAAWPKGPVAAFALLHRSSTDPRAREALDPCSRLQHGDLLTRSNMVAALRQASSLTCAVGVLRAEDRHAISEAPAEQPRLREGTRTLGQPAAPVYAARAAGEPAAWIDQDSSMIVSLPDAADRVDWPTLRGVREVSAFVPADVTR
jgi:HEAT repeat protein